MFDVSFSELVLILIVGLLVFGPEKLPEVVRTAGLWIGKMRRTFTQMRSEIEREMGVDEIKRDLHNNEIMQNLKGVHHDLLNTQQKLQQLPYDVRDVVQQANALKPDAVTPDIEKPTTVSTTTSTTILPEPTADTTPTQNSHHDKT